MPSKIQLDENLWFLYVCLQKSDYKAVRTISSPLTSQYSLLPPFVHQIPSQIPLFELYNSGKYLIKAKTNPAYIKIDFNAVGNATNLKPPAARMRYTRLRRQIEGGTLIGTHGTPFAGGAEKIAEAMRKRKKGGGGRNAIKSDENRGSSSVESERGYSEDGVDERGGGGEKGRKGVGRKGETRVKIEDGFGMDGGQYESRSESESGEDSDDDKPIVKRRGRPFAMTRNQTQNREMETATFTFPNAASTTEDLQESQFLGTTNREYASRQLERIPETDMETEMPYPDFASTLRESTESESNHSINTNSNPDHINGSSTSFSTIPSPSRTSYPPFTHQIRPRNHSYFQRQNPLISLSPEFSHHIEADRWQRHGEPVEVQYDFVPIASLLE